MKLPFNNPPKAVIAIVVVLLLAFAYWAKAAEVELGPTYTSQFNGGVGLSLIQRVADDKVDIGISLIGKQEWERASVQNNGAVWFAYVAPRPESWTPVLPAEVHIGAGAWFQKDREPITNCHPTFLLGLKWRFGDHASVGIRHWSNSGVCSKNRGQDMLTFGWRF